MWSAAAETIEIFEKFCIGRKAKNGVTIARDPMLLFSSLPPAPCWCLLTSGTLSYLARQRPRQPPQRLEFPTKKLSSFEEI